MKNGSRLLDKINSLVENIVFILYLGLVVIGGLQVFNRFVISKPLTWSEEITKILFFYIIFLGAALALRTGSFAIVDFIYDRVPKKARGILDFVINFIIILFLITIIVLGVKICMISYTQVTPALQMPQSVPYLSVPLGGVLMLIFAIELIFKNIKRKNEN